MPHYIALIHKDADSDYSVSFPDFPGCVTAGSTIDEAKDLAHEALALHIKGMIEDGDRIPEPTTLEAVQADPASGDDLAFMLVSGPDCSVRSVRVNVTIPEDALRQIDEYAEQHGFTRSGFLVRAARAAMGR